MSRPPVNRRRSAYATLVGSVGSTGVAAVQALVLLPLYLHEVGAHLYGAWLATGEALVWLLAFDFGIPNLLIQRTGAFLARGERREIGSHFATSLIGLLCLATLLYALVWVFAPYVGGFVGVHDSSLVGPLRTSALATGLMLVSYGFVGLARGMQDTAFVQATAFVGTLLGFLLTVVLLLSHYGLAAIAYGLLARSGTSFLGGILFVSSRRMREVVRYSSPSRSAFNDILKNGPPMFAAGLAYALMNNSMLTVCAVMFGPVSATVLGVTRKAADLAKMVLDMIGHASYGGFAHLWSEGDRGRTAPIYRELQSTFFMAGTALLASYVAINQSFVSNWVGQESYGGFSLTLALALSTVASSWSYLQIGVFRAMGHHGPASGALLVECVARLGLMLLLAWWFGVVGLASGALVTAVASGAWCSLRIKRELPASHAVSVRREWMWRLLPFVLAAGVGAVGIAGGWVSVVSVGALFFLGGAALQVATDPSLGSIKRRLAGGRV